MFSEELALLIASPTIQRLRHVRLSNIDSIDLPSIANISRFEHVLGVAHLADVLGFRSTISTYDALVISSSALLHDWAITSFGHLVEEALQYVGTGFNHELRLSQLLSDEADELFGADLQILQGQETGLRRWATQIAGGNGQKLLSDIMEHIKGGGAYGPIIAGDIDIDNIDNIFRMQFHMGLLQDRDIAKRLVNNIVGLSSDQRSLTFQKNSKPDIETWISSRSDVYHHLMLGRRDFVGKVMLLYATILAFNEDIITLDDWKLTDSEFINRLISCGNKDVLQTVKRWLLGDIWDATPLFWVKGKRPEYPELLKYSNLLSDELSRVCFSYGIKDKRTRKLDITFEDGTREVSGANADKWLFGVASPLKRSFKKSEIDISKRLLEQKFSTQITGTAEFSYEPTSGLF
ncbi:HD domain-containing protein [Roseibium sp. M-1]